MWSRFVLSVALTLASGAAAATQTQAQEQEQAAPKQPVLAAEVNGESVPLAEFERAVQRALSQRVYHGRVKEEQLLQIKQETIDELIDARLLEAEAIRRGIQPDMEAVERRLAELDGRYADSEQWQGQRDVVLPQLREQMMRNSRRARLAELVRDVEAPSEEELRAFYDSNADLFTEPVRERLAVILLKVDPGALQATWEGAKAEAERIHEKLLNGADFAETARLRSGDKSAQDGGDLGYVHRGMLSPEAQAAVDELVPGEISEPVLILQGYAIFKLVDRRAARLRPFEEVRERAESLYLRTAAEEQWDSFLEGLRARAEVWVNPLVLAAGTTSDAEEPGAPSR